MPSTLEICNSWFNVVLGLNSELESPSHSTLKSLLYDYTHIFQKAVLSTMPSLLQFRVECNSTKPGEAVFVVGSAPELGAWDAQKGVPCMTTAQSFPVWTSPDVVTLVAQITRFGCCDSCDCCWFLLLLLLRFGFGDCCDYCNLGH